MSELKPCPVCGKKPKVKSEYYGCGAYCTIQCKPMIGRPHLKVEQGKSTWERAFKYAVEEWNRRAGEEE